MTPNALQTQFNPSVVRRQKMVKQVCSLLELDAELMVLGPAQWGKSQFITWDLLQDEALVRRFPNRIFLDCFTLRMGNPGSFEWEATRGLYGGREREFQQFMNTLTAEEDHNPQARQHERPNISKAQPLISYIHHQAKTGATLIVVDHLDCLSDTPAMESWLLRFRSFLLSTGCKVIWVERARDLSDSRFGDLAKRVRKRAASPYGSKMQDRERQLPVEVHIPPLDRDEIDAWLQSPAFGDDSMPMGDWVLEATGGLPLLVYDFGLYLLSHEYRGREAVERYVEDKSALYSRACYGLLCVLRDYPEEFGQWKTAPSKSLSKALWLTGAFELKGEHSLEYASPIYKKRSEEIVSIENLLLMGKQVDPSEVIEYRTKWKTEVMTLPLMRYLLSVQDCQGVFQSLNTILVQRFKIKDLKFMLREIRHPVVWFSYDPKLKATRKTLIHQAQEDFVGVSRSGRLQYCPSRHRIILPVVGASGCVDLLLSAELPDQYRGKNWRLESFNRMLNDVVQALQPVLARAAEGFFLRRFRNGMDDLLRTLNRQKIRTNQDDPDLFLHEAGCEALAILIQRKNQWLPWIFGSIPGARDIQPFKRRDLLEQPDPQSLWQHAWRSDARELVLGPARARLLFPRLEREGYDNTLFIKPLRVAAEGQENRYLVLFVFQSDKKPDMPGWVLDEFKRQHLSIIAHRLAVFGQYQVWMAREYKRELDLFNQVGAALSLVQSEPVQAQEKIVSSLKSFFQVSALSIDDVVEMPDIGGTSVKVRRRCSKGYHDDYARHVYAPEQGHPEEGKTGYIARTGRTLVSSLQEGDARPVDQYLDPDGTGTLIPLNEDINGRDYCAETLREGRERNFLGTPIRWNDDEEPGKEKIIGVLKMANRTGEQVLSFTEKDAAAAERIARLLAPALYMLQHRGEFGLRQRLVSMEAMMRGIEHEIRNPLAKIRGAYDMLLYWSDPAPRSQLQIIYDQVRQISAALTELRGLATRDAGHPACVPVRQAVEQAWLSVAVDWPLARMIHWENCVPDEMAVKIDRGYFQRAVRKILDNACENLAQTDQPSITVSCWMPSTAEVVLLIADNGPGVPQKIEDKVFEPFQSGHASKVANGKPGKIRGIGLAIVRAIVENAGGRVSYETAGGACFKITLPPF